MSLPFQEVVPNDRFWLKMIEMNAGENWLLQENEIDCLFILEIKTIIISEKE